ncbi:MAG: outer membrane integrity protein [Cytophaga sp.]|uniref:outer membrane integrity protein n=1 Tax=Cytophaga sp. TaxID=29535 RepID=UPI003F7DAA8E
MRKLAFIILLSLGCLVASQQNSYAQTEPDASSGGGGKPAKVKKERSNKGHTQADLDAENAEGTKNQMTPEAIEYQKRMAKAKKEKEKRNAVTRKQADKRASKRLNAAKKKTTKKKKSYVKSKNKK